MPKWLEIEGLKRMNLDDLVRFAKADIAAGRQECTSNDNQACEIRKEKFAACFGLIMLRSETLRSLECGCIRG